MQVTPVVSDEVAPRVNVKANLVVQIGLLLLDPRVEHIATLGRHDGICIRIRRPEMSDHHSRMVGVQSIHVLERGVSGIRKVVIGRDEHVIREAAMERRLRERLARVVGAEQNVMRTDRHSAIEIERVAV